MRQDTWIVKDLITNGHGALCFGDSFATIYRDLVTEHFNKETKGTAVHFPSGYSPDIYLCSKQMDKNFTARCEQCCGRNQMYLPRKFIKKWHQEIKGCIFSMLTTLRLVLSNKMSTFLETVQVEISQLVEKLIRKLLTVFYMYR